MRVPRFIVLIVMLAVALGFTAATMTGHVSRSYPVLLENATVILCGQSILINDVVRQYQPQIFMRPRTVSPHALYMTWEAINMGQSIGLLYHIVWEDEVHPIPLIDWVDRYLRATYYGMSDIEYVELVINRTTGVIKRIRYEGTTAPSYDNLTGSYRYAIVKYDGTQYVETSTSSNAPASSKSIVITNRQLPFGVANWSHRLALLEPGDSTYTIPVPLTLMYLSDSDYAGDKMARRSQGDFVTTESLASRISCLIVPLVVVGVGLVGAVVSRPIQNPCN